MLLIKFLIKFEYFQEGGELFPNDADGNEIFSEIDYLETWNGMEGVATKGLAKSIGLSNFNSQQVKRVLDHCTIKPVCNQVLVTQSLPNQSFVNLNLFSNR